MNFKFASWILITFFLMSGYGRAAEPATVGEAAANPLKRFLGRYRLYA